MLNYSVSLRQLFISLVLLVVLATALTDSHARRKRKYYPELTRQKATELMRTSPELCDILGLEPILMDSLMILELESQSEAVIDEINTESKVVHTNSDNFNKYKPIFRTGAYTKQDINTYVDKHIDELDDTQLNQLWTAYITEGEMPQYTDAGIEKGAIADAFMYWLGTPYKWAGLTEKGIDCSAFVREVFRSSGQMELPRTSRAQYRIGEPVEKEDLLFGDLVFFKTNSRGRITHVGIYLSDDLFVHASSRQGVTVSSLSSSYYSRAYRGARRITVRDLDELTIVQGNDLDRYNFD